MPKVKSVAWRFFASVKLALTVLIILASTSIIGTIIQQGKEFSYYVEEYGANLAFIFKVLDLPDMYNSWWYVTLLGFFAVNLIVCTIERLPGVWRMVVLDNLDIDLQRLEKMSFTHRTDTCLTASAAAEQMRQCMVQTGWKNSRRLDRDGVSLFFAQKGAWTRLGVYVVHLSVLFILVGAMIGMFFGSEAYVYLPEGRTTNTIFARGSKEPVPLGFELTNDRFKKTIYSTGMVKEYRADLTVSDPERGTSLQKSVIVNDPLSYRGFSFYLGDSYPLKEFFVTIRNRATGAEQAFRVPPETNVVWKETGVSFRIEELKGDQEGAVEQAKIRFTADASAEPSVFWLKDKGAVTVRESGKEFTIDFRQLYSILLLVKKDPGLWAVFFGCILMIAGLCIVLFLSHRRIWVRVISRSDGEGSQILISGVSNKNKPAFERLFQELVDVVDRDAATLYDNKSP